MVVMPMTAFMGVRISLLIRERKSDLARLACSAAVRASLMICRFRSASRSFSCCSSTSLVMSRI